MQPGKIDSPLNTMLEQVEWGNFRLGDLFEVNSSKAIFHANNIKNIYDAQVEGSLPYVVRTTQNNGIRGYIIEDKNLANDGDSLSFAQDTFSVFYQKQKYFTGNKVKILKAKFKNTNGNIYQFICACFQKSLETFTRGTGSTVETISETIVQLPIKNGEIDFEFMDKFIAELEKNYLKEGEYLSDREINAYLQVTGLKDYELTSEELNLLKDFEEGKFEWKEFKIGGDNGLFMINSSKKKFDANKVNILDYGKPYIVRTANNNGLRGYLDEDEQFLNDGNTISFGQDTATMFYQEKPYFTGDKIKVVKSKSEKFNKANAHFFITSMTKAFSTFSRGQSSFNVKIIENQDIYLPTKDHKPDYEFMETFISAIQKLVIKDIVIYNQERIKATAEIINN